MLHTDIDPGHIRRGHSKRSVAMVRPQVRRAMGQVRKVGEGIVITALSNAAAWELTHEIVRHLAR